MLTIANRFHNAKTPIKSEVMFKTATDAKHAQLVRSQMLRELDAILQDQFADATRSWMQVTNAKPAHWTNLPTQVLPLVSLFQIAMPIQSEVMFKTATDAKHAQLVRSQMLRELDAILQDQLADATRSWTHQLTYAKPAH